MVYLCKILEALDQVKEYVLHVLQEWEKDIVLEDLLVVLEELLDFLAEILLVVLQEPAMVYLCEILESLDQVKEQHVLEEQEDQLLQAIEEQFQEG